MCAYIVKWWQFVVLFGIVFPIGCGLQFFTNINIGMEWFPENMGLMAGTMIGGYGSGVFFFGTLTTSIANPDDMKNQIPDYGAKTTD